MQTNQDNSESSGRRISRQILLTIRDVAIVAVAMFLLLNYVFVPSVVSGASMEPTLHNGDLLFVRKLGYTPSYGDIVTVESEGVTLVKRVIGLDGDTVEIDYETDTVTVNGEVIYEPYIVEDMINIVDHESSSATYVVPSGYIFVLGDNRNKSSDSRQLGFIPHDDIIGKPMITIRRG